MFLSSYIKGKAMTGERDAGRMARRIVDLTGEKYVVIKMGASFMSLRASIRSFRSPRRLWI